MDDESLGFEVQSGLVSDGMALLHRESQSGFGHGFNLTILL